MSPPPNARRQLLAAVAAGSVSGLLFGLSLPKVDVGPMAWVALVPLLWFLLRGPRAAGSSGPAHISGRHAAAAGLAFGVVAGTFRVYWVAETLGLYGGLGLAEATATTLLLILYLALYPALFCWICRRCVDDCRSAFPWLAGSTWVLLDWAQTWMFSGFPWAVAGTSQYATPVVAALAALAGVHGIAFALVAVNAGLALMLSGTHRVAGAVAVAAPAVVVLAWGTWYLNWLQAEPTPAALRIGIVQGNIRQDVKWEPDWKESTTRKYLDLTRHLAQSEAQLDRSIDLIVWPETALPFRLDDLAHAGYLHAVSELAVELETPLLIGSLGTHLGTTPGLYNRAFLIDRQGQVTGYGDKVHLVPFGEYLPLPWLFDYMSELTAQSGAFDPGAQHAVLQLAPAGARLGLFVCYESIFPAITRDLAQRGASVLVNTTNDAWFGTTAAPYQHFAMVVIRAMETGRAVVRAANTGISGAVGPDGTVLQATELFDTAAIVATIVPRTHLTPYVRFGDLIVVISAFVWAACLWWFVQRRRRRVLTEIQRARMELDALAAQPEPLRRPVVLLPGYGCDATVFAALRGDLQRCFVEPKIIELDLRHDDSIAGLVSRSRACLPAEPCDFVGHSLGGLVAVGLVRKQDAGAWVFSLASPFGGTALARIARKLGFRFPATLADLQPDSPELSTVRQALRGLSGFRALRLQGDPIDSGLPAGHHEQTIAPPALIGPRRRHGAIVADPRAIVAVIRSLRSRP